MEEIERWKDIPGYEGLYRASTFGKIKSLSVEKINHTGGVWISKPIILRQGTNRQGYRTCVLVRLRKDKSFLVHRLIALTFIGKSNLEVNHKDKCVWNNHLTNLEYVTKRENISHKFNKSETSSYRTGVYFNKKSKKFQACININGKNYNLGQFDNEEQAGDKYDLVLKENGIINRYSKNTKQ